MTTIALEQEAYNYWEQLKGASDKVKLTLISLLSTSLVSKDVEVTTEQKRTKPIIKKEDLEITPFVETIGKGIKPLPADFDYEKAKHEYLMEKYG
jgi:hypothetical protein